MSFGHILKSMRETKRITREEAAEFLMMPLRQFDMMEAAQMPPSGSTLIPYCNLIGISPETLLQLYLNDHAEKILKRSGLVTTRVKISVTSNEDNNAHEYSKNV